MDIKIAYLNIYFPPRSMRLSKKSFVNTHSITIIESETYAASPEKLIFKIHTHIQTNSGYTAKNGLANVEMWSVCVAVHRFTFEN